MLNDLLATVPVPGMQSGDSGTKWVVLALILTTVVAPTWLGWWNARITKKQVTPNGGSSLKDQVTKVVTKVEDMTTQNDRIEVKVDLAATKVELAKVQIEKHEAQITDISAKLDSLVLASSRTREQVAGYVADIKSDVSDLHQAQEQRRETVESESGS